MRPLEGLRHWAQRTPDAAALIDGTTSMSFNELYAFVMQASAIGRTALSYAPGDAYLPVIVDRSARSAAAILACYFGRVRFVPIGTGASAELKQHLARRAGDAGRFVDATMKGDDIPGVRRVELSANTMTPTADEFHDVQVSDDEPGLVLYSSGSTGIPKGIVLPWRSMEARWRRRHDSYADFGDDRRQPLVVPLDSSFGLQELAGVASGFTQYIVDVTHLQPSRYLTALADFAPTAMTIPSQFGRLLAQLPTRSVVPLPSVRRVHLGSEGFSYEHMVGLGAVFRPNTLIVHSLASTEGGVEMLTQFALGAAPSTGTVHVGRILHPDCVHLEPVEGLEACEVHVSGAIASAYLDDPDLTAERFYEKDGTRWWRSRDLVVMDANGQFLHAGRMDDVVKVGSRLASPSDVTAILLGIDGVTGAITIPVTTNGTTRLVAHVDTAPGTSLTLPQVCHVLATRLPPHAVPSAVMRHAHLPTNTRGKIDRAALMNGPFEPW